jgi:hypothetical protein
MKRLGVALLLIAGCAKDPAPALSVRDPGGPPQIAAPLAITAGPLAASDPIAITPGGRAKPSLDRARYPWLADANAPDAVEPLEARFDPPDGFTRVEVAARSFGAWLRGLPLRAPGTPVLAFDGATIRGADDDHVAAVVAMDVSPIDVQQCADSVIRLHAEWRWSEGDRAMSYRAASGIAMPLARWMNGDRIEPRGATIDWVPGRARAATHASFRQYLDAVFGYANTGSLARDAKAIDAAALRPGDFVVMPGGPGHAVLVLDLATRSDGTRAALLGQGFMPAQSFHVLRPSRASAWFVIPPGSTELQTPFWRAFPWSLLRRLD